LHPKKIYLQHHTKGVKYLGTVIMPNRIYTANRTIGNFYDSVENWNKIIREKKKLTRYEIPLFLSSMNSYLGITKHYSTYKIRKRIMLKKLSAYSCNHVYFSSDYTKLVAKVRYL